MPDKKYYEANKERLKESNKKYYKEHYVKEVHAAKQRIKNFGVTQEEYDRMLEAQNGVCAVCGGSNKGKGLCVDHDHITGKVRGLLCHKCNLALGMAEDNLETLKNLVTYLLHK